MRWLRWSIVVLGALVLVAAGRGSAGGERTNRAAAQHDAAQLLERVALPGGAIPSLVEPAGDDLFLSRPGQVPEAVNLIDRHLFWTVAEDETDVSAFVRAHQPAGTQAVTEGIGDGQAQTDALTFALPSVGHVLGTRWLAVALTSLPGGGTGVRVDAEVQWLVPRPANERIPHQARFLEVTVRRPPHSSFISDVSVTNLAKIRRIGSLIDGLEPMQPGAFDCTEELENPVVIFTFRSAPGGRVLARATQIVEPGATGPTSSSSESCEPMTVTIRGRTATPLLDGVGVVHAAQRLLGIRLPRGWVA